ncbi:MAG: flavodoxin domain-containing protein [Candidatus Hodarchaeota archaeon]
MKTLIAYGTRYGATQGIAERMSEWLQENNIDSEIINVKKDPWPELSRYNGLIMGSGIKIGQWTKEMKNFIKKKKDEINAFSGPKVFFVCSGYAAIPERYNQIKEEYCKKALENIGVNLIDDYEAFGGVMDASPDSPVGWLDKKILKIAGKESSIFDPNGVNDYRDWDQIENFTKEFIQMLLKI